MNRVAKIRLATAVVLVVGIGAGIIAQILSLDTDERAASVFVAVVGAVFGAAFVLAFRRRYDRRQEADSEGASPFNDIGRPSPKRVEKWSNIGLFAAIASVPFWSLLPPAVLVGMLSTAWGFLATAVLVFGRRVSASEESLPQEASSRDVP